MLGYILGIKIRLLDLQELHRPPKCILFASVPSTAFRGVHESGNPFNNSMLISLIRSNLGIKIHALDLQDLYRPALRIL